MPNSTNIPLQMNRRPLKHDRTNKIRIVNMCIMLKASKASQSRLSLFYTIYTNRFLRKIGTTYADPEGGHKNIEFLSNAGPDPLKNHIPNQHSMLGHHWHASEMPFKWRFSCGPMMARFLWYLALLVN